MPAADPDGRIVPTGFAALDAILGTGGLPRSATVALRGDASSGKTTVALRVAAEAQAGGAIVAWLDLARAFDPVEAVARGVRPEWLVVLTPMDLEEALALSASLLTARTVDLLVVDLPDGRDPAVAGKRVGDRLGRLAALARRAGTLLVVLEPSALGRGLAAAVEEASGLRLELRRSGWIRLGRDVVGQRSAVTIARNRYGPPGRHADLEILYADGGTRDACLLRDDLLAGPVEPPAPPGRSRRCRARSRRPRPCRHPRSPPIGKAPLHRSNTPMRLLHLLWPHLPLRLARARLERPSKGGTSGSWPPGPIVLGGQPWTDGTVVDVDPLARALGVRRGIPLGSAHRLAPEATFLDLAPDPDGDAVEAACERLAGFSPGIAGTSDVTDTAFGRLAVHVDGLTRLFGPEEVLVARISVALAPILPGPPRAGIAGTGFAATVAAAHAAEGGPPVLVPPGDDGRFLAPFPARLLTRDPDIRARLGRFGLRTIGSVAELPRSAVVARFGEEGALLHARARGEETERFQPRRAPERMVLALPLDPPVEGLEAVRFVLRRLVAALADQLVARGRAAGIARLVVRYDLSFARRGSAPELRVEQRLPEPTADAEAIERLLLARLERTPPGAAVARLELELAMVEAATGQQLPMFTPQAARDARLNWQLARLAIAFGADRVRRVEITDPEAPLAESRWRWTPVAGATVMGEEGRS